MKQKGKIVVPFIKSKTHEVKFPDRTAAFKFYSLAKSKCQCDTSIARVYEENGIITEVRIDSTETK